jgi:phosphomannomutase
MIYLFDVDGTLTPSRQKIEPAFAEWFKTFISNNEVYLVTGSDYSKTVEQLGEDICQSVDRVYNCSGNDVWKRGKNIRTSDWTLPDECLSFLSHCLQQSMFPLRTGNHIENRPGSVNFSVVGRNASLAERKLYVKWDAEMDERMNIAKMFNEKFKDVVAKIGGETGIDIHPVGCDKSQVLKHVLGEVMFFGDAIYPSGNDWELAEAILQSNRGTVYKVTDWTETWQLLKNI